MRPNWYFLPSLTMVIASLFSSLATFQASSRTTSAFSPLVSLQPSLRIFSFSVWSMKRAARALNLSSGSAERSISTSPDSTSLPRSSVLFLAK